MFHKKQKKVDLVFWVFGVIALAIVVSMAVLLVQLFSKTHQTAPRIDNNPIQETSRPTFTPEELFVQYNGAVNDLFVEVVEDMDTPVDELLTHIEEELLAMRVPREMQDRHLQVVLAVAQLRVRLATQDEDIQRQDIRSVFDPLLLD